MKKPTFLFSVLITICLLGCSKKDSKPYDDPNKTTYAVSTIAGGNITSHFLDGTGSAASFSAPSAIVISSSGDLYVADNNRIRKVTPAGAVTTFVGSIMPSTGYADGTGTNALFNSIQGMVLDAAGNLFVTDWENHRIRKITPTGVVTTFAGNGVSQSVDGTGINASFRYPKAITIDAVGNLYVSESEGMRKITPLGVVTTLVTTGVNSNPYNALVMDPAGNIYGTTLLGIVKITPAGVSAYYTGTQNEQGAFVDGTLSTARYFGPKGIIIDGSGNMYVSDSANHRIRKITSSGAVSTFAGSGTQGNLDGTVLSAQFNSPDGLALDASGNLYVADQGGFRIRKISKQ